MKKTLILLYFLLLFSHFVSSAQCPFNIIKSVEKVNVTCYGSANGAFIVLLNDSLAKPLSTFVRDSSSVISENLRGSSILSSRRAGVYIFTVQDAKGCKDSVKVTITQPPPLRIELKTIKCDDGSSNGIAEMIGKSGDSIFFVNQPNGIYRDLANGQTLRLLLSDGICFVSDEFIFSSKCLTPRCTYPIIKDTVIKNPTCGYIDDGAVRVNLTNAAIKPLFYSLINNLTNELVSRNDSVKTLFEGSYSYIVKDGDGCRDTSKIILKSPFSVSINFNILNCDNGSGNGRLKAFIKKNDSTYIYKWENGDTILTNLKAGEVYWARVMEGRCATGNSIIITKCSSTPVNDIDEKSITVYPNPAHNNISIKSPFIILKVEISDISGKTVVVFDKITDYTVPLSIAQRGLLFLKVFTDKGVFIKKIIRQ